MASAAREIDLKDAPNMRIFFILRSDAEQALRVDLEHYNDIVFTRMAGLGDVQAGHFRAHFRIVVPGWCGERDKS